MVLAALARTNSGTPRASAVVGGAATGQANGASDGAGDVVVVPRSWMVAVGARVGGPSGGLCPVLVCRGRHCLWGGALLFILGSNLGGVGPGRGLRGGGRRGWYEE